MRNKVALTGALLAMFFGTWPLQAIPKQELKEKYEPIIQRNPFGLRPIVVPQQQVPTNAAPPPPKNEIYLTGIISVGYPTYPKKAYLMLREQTGKKETNYLSFVEGQKQKDIEVLAINDKDRTVKIRNSDGEILLSFKTHGLTNAVVALPQVGRPGQPGVPNVGGAPGAIPPPPMAAPGTRPTASSGGVPPPLTPDGGNPNVTRAINPAMRGVASRNRSRRADVVVGNPGAPGAANDAIQQQPEAEPVDAAQQYINLLAEEEMARRRGQILPPTPPL